MSKFLEWTEAIKASATSDWLTHGQRKAFERLKSGWRSHQFVSLAGAKGSGKSFIARLLVREVGYTYARHLDSELASTTHVVLDDRPFTRADQMLATALGLERVVFVDERPPKEGIPCAQIVLDEKDIEEFLHALYKHGVLRSFHTKPVSTNLEQILITEAASRGVGDA